MSNFGSLWLCQCISSLLGTTQQQLPTVYSTERWHVSKQEQQNHPTPQLHAELRTQARMFVPSVLRRWMHL
jgi:hypothetical protein